MKQLTKRQQRSAWHVTSCHFLPFLWKNHLVFPPLCVECSNNIWIILSGLCFSSLRDSNHVLGVRSTDVQRYWVPMHEETQQISTSDENWLMCLSKCHWSRYWTTNWWIMCMCHRACLCVLWRVKVVPCTRDHLSSQPEERKRHHCHAAAAAAATGTYWADNRGKRVCAL